MTWQRGREEVQRLLAGAELEEVPADQEGAAALIDTARRHVRSARTIATDDPAGAFQAAYDALRKSAAALLSAQGLRATSRGGHLAVRDSVKAQFGGSGGTSAFAAFDRMRRTRNSLEYPSAGSPGVDADDVAWAIEQADRGVQFAADVLSSGRLSPWR